MHHFRISTRILRLVVYTQKLKNCYVCSDFATYTDTIDVDMYELFQKKTTQARNYITTDFNFRYFNMTDDSKNVVANLTTDIDASLRDLTDKNKNKQVAKLLNDCLDKRKLIDESVLKELFRHYSLTGKLDIVLLLQKYCSMLFPELSKRNGEFLHYIAKAQCMRGNSENGLSVLKKAYIKYERLRSFYRIILRELIHDSVLYRSEASLVVFRKYVIEFSEQWNDHYPLVCYWYICWSSSWFSDQMLSNDLLESSENLQKILKEKCTEFSISILRQYNEDAVVRLLQNLLKYNMIEEYARVLQILFGYKLKGRDLKGCSEIIKNCEVLGISLPSSQQGRYIKMLINNQATDDAPKPTKPRNFKLKF